MTKLGIEPSDDSVISFHFPNQLNVNATGPKSTPTEHRMRADFLFGEEVVHTVNVCTKNSQVIKKYVESLDHVLCVIRVHVCVGV